MRCAFVINVNTLKRERYQEALREAYQQGERPKVKVTRDPGAIRQRSDATVALGTGLRTRNLERTRGLCVLIYYIWAPET